MLDGNFEAFGKTISSRIKLLFLKSQLIIFKITILSVKKIIL